MKAAFLFSIFTFFGVTALAQTSNIITIEAPTNITIVIDRRFYIIPIAEKNQLQILNKVANPPFKEGFNIQSSHNTCEILFAASSIRKSSDEVSVILHIATLDGKRSSSFNKRIKVKMREQKDLILKSKLKCMNYQYHSVRIIY